MLILVLGVVIVVLRLNISVNAGIILNIQQIINVNISLGDSMTVIIIRVYVFVGASVLL